MACLSLPLGAGFYMSSTIVRVCVCVCFLTNIHTRLIIKTGMSGNPPIIDMSPVRPQSSFSFFLCDLAKGPEGSEVLRCGLSTNTTAIPFSLGHYEYTDGTADQLPCQ